MSKSKYNRVLDFDNAQVKEITLFSKKQKGGITGPLRKVAKNFLNNLREYDEWLVKTNPATAEPHMNYCQLLTTIKPTFISFSKQIVRSWIVNMERVESGLYQMPNVSMQTLTTLSMTRGNITASDTIKHCNHWSDWFLNRIAIMKLQYNKSRAYVIQDKAIEYTCAVMIDRLTESLSTHTQIIKGTTSIYLSKDKPNQVLYLNIVPENGKVQKLFTLPYTNSDAFIEKANNKLLYILRDLILPGSYIRDEINELPVIDNTLSNDVKF